MDIQVDAAATIQVTGFAPTVSVGVPVFVIPIVLLGVKYSEGHYIDAVAPGWFRALKLIQSDPGAFHQLTPSQWEEIVAGGYQEMGYQETLTPRSGDKGRDFIAERPGSDPVRILGQVKKYSPGHLVDAETVRSLYGVMQLDDAQFGVVATTSDFAPRIRWESLLSKIVTSKVELLNGAELLAWLEKVAKGKGD